MKIRRITFILPLLAVAIGSCNQRSDSNDLKLYFDKGELSEHSWSDSLSNIYFSEELSLLNEPSLKDTTNRNHVLRLTVFNSIKYVPYCVKLKKLDSLYRVSFKIKPKKFQASGLNGLSLNYDSDSESMDSIYQAIKLNIDSLDIFALNNISPEIVTKNNIQGADGTTYLLEYYSSGKYVALTRWDIFLDKKYYHKSDEFVRLVQKLHRLIPSGLLQDIDAAREPSDLKFEIFKAK